MISYTDSPLLALLRSRVPAPPRGVREEVVRQLILGLEHFYCHLPQKRAAFGIDQIAMLKLLATDTEHVFIRQILRIVTSLRDRHTTLRLPPPWAAMVVYLPLIIERIYSEAQPRYVVTKSLFGYDGIPIGSTITHWNGMPVHLYVNALANDMQGAGWAAQTQLALANLTIRPLAYVLMPGEDWVSFTYLTSEGETRTTATPWRFYVQGVPGSGSSPATGRGGAEMGLDEQTGVINRFKTDASGPRSETAAALTTEGHIRYGTVDTPSGLCAYLRIFSFEVADATTFVARIAEILSGLPQERLIIDVRGNPGGLIPAGQSLIRLLIDRDISPAPVNFRSTWATTQLSSIDQFREWRSSLTLQLDTGDSYSQAFPISQYYEGAPAYRYPGKTALIIDALCYSTTDFFAADFADNRIGPIVGTDVVTGGGGANVWPWDVLVTFASQTEMREAPAPLPGGFDLNISMRRALRTGAYAGLPIENLGVRANTLHRLTLRDLIEANADLIATAAAQIA